MNLYHVFLLKKYAGKGQLIDLYKDGKMDPKDAAIYKEILWAYDFV